MSGAALTVEMIGLPCPTTHRDVANYADALAQIGTPLCTAGNPNLSVGCNPLEPNGLTIAIFDPNFGIVTALLSPQMADHFASIVAEKLLTRESVQ